LDQLGDINASHKLASLTGEGRLAKTGDPSYAKRIYDDMADQFENKLVNCLGYRGPWILCSMLLSNLQREENFKLEDPLHKWRIIDLGCGSGLVGRLLRDMMKKYQDLFDTSKAYSRDYQSLRIDFEDTNQLNYKEATSERSERDLQMESLNQYATSHDAFIVGVDISARMAEIAFQNGGYDNVVCGDLHEALALFDPNRSTTSGIVVDGLQLVVAADTFIYVGSLGKIFMLVKSVLKRHGYFMFSIEEMIESTGSSMMISSSHYEVGVGENEYEIIGAIPGWGAKLTEAARFAHSHHYIETLSTIYGFRILEHQRQTIRNEGTVPLPGIFYLLQLS
jgi:predicted TPR repeat methyltransferase